MENFTNALYEIIGRRIKELRNKMNLNQEELALKIGMGRASISNIELGRHQAPLHVLIKIATAVNAEIHTLLPTKMEVEEFINSNNSNSQFNSILDNANITESTKENVKSIIDKI